MSSFHDKRTKTTFLTKHYSPSPAEWKADLDDCTAQLKLVCGDALRAQDPFLYAEILRFGRFEKFRHIRYYDLLVRGLYTDGVKDSVLLRLMEICSEDLILKIKFAEKSTDRWILGLWDATPQSPDQQNLLTDATESKHKVASEPIIDSDGWQVSQKTKSGTKPAKFLPVSTPSGCANLYGLLDAD